MLIKAIKVIKAILFIVLSPILMFNAESYASIVPKQKSTEQNQMLFVKRFVS